MFNFNLWSQNNFDLNLSIKNVCMNIIEHINNWNLQAP